MIEDSRKIYVREDLEYCHSRLNIERQLQMYEKHPDKNERAATLWHAWHQNKKWLIRLLELTLAAFPSYSRHDASHADAVLHNIERVLGESRIALLSATDCFAILHTVYIHDIGMAILAEDRENIIKSDEFVEMIDELSEGADKDLKKAAMLLKKKVYARESVEEIDFDGVLYHNEKKKLYKDKLETYYAVVQLLAEYQRKRHGEKAASDVKDWIFDQNKLRSEFAMSGIPMRIFLRIADCAALHTDWEFQHIMDLPSEENGYENDMLHPRFVAVLLQLGDALDIDNDRFHPFAYAFSGSFPVQSQAHYNKHLAIRTLKITPEEIVIEADCETRESMRLIRNDCDGIERLLKSASYYWSSIAPRGFSGALPSFKLSRLLLDGKEIPWDLALSRFQISQQKAFSLLQGENIYSGYFPFVRELLQNAIDSTKIQCYEDYITSSKFRFGDNPIELNKPGITDFSKVINPVEYPIEITIECGKVDSEDNWKRMDFKDIPVLETEKERYGILFCIKDYGTGINAETLRNISNVGTSYKSRKKLLREIPDWLRPTGEFGIGLQSVFLVSDNFCCETYVRNGECYHIEFLTGANGKMGYINVIPHDATKKHMAFGTEFQVFISHNKKKKRTECMDAWIGYDPFANDYECSQIKRDIVALTIQILLDIDGQLEDLLFPIYASVKFDLGEEHRELLKSKLSKVVFSNMENNYTEESLREHMCWIYKAPMKNNKGNVIQFLIDRGVCQVDLMQMKINLWIEDLAVSACLGVDFAEEENYQPTRSLCKFYYKGILIEKYDISKSGNLVEYIDIQGGRNGRKLIQLSRNGFTQEGRIYIETIVIPRIYKTLFDVLKTLASQTFVFEDTQSDQPIRFAEKLEKNMEKVFPNDKIWKKQLIGISLYYNFYMRELEKRKSPYLLKREESERKQWDDAIRNISSVVNKKQSDTMDIYCRLVAIEVSADLESKEFLVLGKKEITIADFYNKQNKFVVVSKRRDKGDKWINSLIWLKTSDNSDVKLPQLIDALNLVKAQGVLWTDWNDRMEDWAKFMLENIDGILEVQSIQQSNFVLTLLQSVSISACFADAYGNLKIHVLSGHSRGSVFYNVHAKYFLLERMAKRKQETNAERFAGNVWMGYELLQVSEIPEDVCSIKEQYIQENRTSMIFPCSGESIQSLASLAKQMDEKDWFPYMSEEYNQTNKYIMHLKDDLIAIAKKLYACITVEYQQVKEDNKELFMELYAAYCKQERVRISEEVYWDLLSTGYSIAFNSIYQRKLQGLKKSEEYISWKKTSVEDFEKKKDEFRSKLPRMEQIQQMSKLISSSILENAESLIGVGSNKKYHSGLDLYMNQLTELCIQWDWLWNLTEHLQLEQRIHAIRGNLLIDSIENKNLILQVSRQTQSEQDDIAEYYDRLWNEMIRSVIRQRRERFTQRPNFKLIDWMEKRRI